MIRRPELKKKPSSTAAAVVSVLLAIGLLLSRIAARGGFDNWLANRDGFDPRADGSINAIVLQPDGKLLVGGKFSKIGGANVSNLARLLPDGRSDPAFADTDVGGEVRTIALDRTGRILIGGKFSSAGGEVRNNIARFDRGGHLDRAFAAGADAQVAAIALQDDGKILLAGRFEKLDGKPQRLVGRLQADGNLDATFVSHFDQRSSSGAYALALQPDGQILVGGEFIFYGDVSSGALLRLNPDGSADNTFRHKDYLIGYVAALALQSDGKVLVGGNLDTYIGAQKRSTNIARFNGDGSIDRSFTLDTDDSVYTIVLQPDGHILLGGLFSSLGNHVYVRSRIARLNGGGDVESAFDPDADAYVHAIAQLPDGKLVVGGGFSHFAQGHVKRYRIARLNSDGSVDRK